jgi:hypothetical protein
MGNTVDWIGLRYRFWMMDDEMDDDDRDDGSAVILAHLTRVRAKT